MLAAIFFFQTFLTWFLITFGLTTFSMSRSLSSAGPARVGAALRSRNRIIILIVILIHVSIALVEVFSVGYSDYFFRYQYGLGDMFNSNPDFFIETPSGGTFTYGFYVPSFAGFLLGIAIGTVAAARRYPVLRGLGFNEVI